ncbi:MAG: SurA N-terminal domain-containing protein [Hyphomicrobiales bacterium]
MRNHEIRVALWVGLGIGVLALLGCSPSDSGHTDDYLVRVGSRKITAHDFRQAFELAKTSHPDSASKSSAALQEARQQLLDEMSIELVMLNRADEVGISVSDGELDEAIKAIQADYPPGVFEQTLIESAVPFEVWKQRMRSRLLMEKLVQAELVPQVAITPQEVADYYDQHYRGKAGEADSEEKFQRLKETIVADLQRKKLEDAFADWIDGLKKKYPVEVNQQLWADLTESSQAPSPPPESPPPDQK